MLTNGLPDCDKDMASCAYTATIPVTPPSETHVLSRGERKVVQRGTIRINAMPDEYVLVASGKPSVLITVADYPEDVLQAVGVGATIKITEGKDTWITVDESCMLELILKTEMLKIGGSQYPTET